MLQVAARAERVRRQSRIGTHWWRYGLIGACLWINIDTAHLIGRACLAPRRRRRGRRCPSNPPGRPASASGSDRVPISANDSPPVRAARPLTASLLAV